MPAKVAAQNQFLNTAKAVDNAVGFWSVSSILPQCHQDVQNYFKQLMIFEPNLYFYLGG